ncbi:uncharacterized mitochondrial protein AtMg00810-like [Nicotiana sylvestris]|uniref:Uncharacterized mitochondrial protein AtMg00810-like n=1 Tax=Nicotiana tabacum TaxID=4097 RepID=A0A1S4AS73_TOBAC|nr:PREDICTED: uncharacterized mitochondrial protein AtMg00810-like [Nicotiana tabacum]
MVTVRSVVALAAASRWYIFQMDVHNAFLQWDLSEESHYDNSLFTQQMGSDLVVILVFVDNPLVTETNLKLIEQVRKDLQVRFKMKDLGELKYFLDIEFSRSENEIQMCQRKYALELVSELGMSGGKPVTTLLEFNHKITSIEFDKIVTKNCSDNDSEHEDKERYQRIVGRVLYLTMTRPDIAFVVQVLNQFMHDPKQSHISAAMRVIKYIMGTPGLGLFMPAGENMKLTAYCESDWGACVETRRSVTSYVIKFGEALIS